ncbi:hypothetical protein Tco_0576671 [Tanacetum coccineum]
MLWNEVKEFSNTRAPLFILLGDHMKIFVCQVDAMQGGKDKNAMEEAWSLSWIVANLPILELFDRALPLEVSLMVDGFLEDSDSLVLLLFVFVPVTPPNGAWTKYVSRGVTSLHTLHKIK